ncbi:UDP-N-acetylglucosamine 2-epimerase [Pelotomaculum terephthalicicum JT]|uniref:UDP-N-acetylglucosamine 2-epimerase n=1 Tax=Pelotomaculum TaxID=191373 RepID=UPI0009CE3C00|nr:MULTISPECIES: UDP-N-acetylglucosamine 2-epimerase [Pelotomaculum]MCG9967989.1 UDP-N-acetylglucosamine 2-epimerase [Pelotomaculum terephthalicicum JT]OPX88589.1 MAG: GDP/UDP-N,N'-diacetylbacillosamine 2-epimerase (hydrolyzing) [Pelotomaculum sp. PtaB.Bin117]OPY63038.1 MAG: GDP/UDP-N,N'-diacetylbacillosamine 2-epimerase (hydrolyzing) [Pelotomaculum sp. PtaU1.Bin065]
MRRVAVFTATRAEYGLLRPVIKSIKNSNRLDLSLIVAGAHLVPGQGLTVQEILDDGFTPDCLIDNVLFSDSPDALVKSVGLGLIEIGGYFTSHPADIILLLGDRYELFIPLVAALMHRVPVAHLCGGETTEGALDEQVRHAITKMAHLHFPSAFEYGRCLRQMGEEAWRIHVVGSPVVENIRCGNVMGIRDINAKFGFNPELPTLLITYHPETIAKEKESIGQIKSLIAALKEFSEYQQVITHPGIEVGYLEVVKVWEEYAAVNPRVKLFNNLGSRGYLGVMKNAAAVVGNSSSGIIEAPSFKVPTVNVGDRQKGRLRAESVIDVSCRKDAIVAGLRRALHEEDFRSHLKETKNPYDPYGDGKVSERVISVLESVSLDRRLLNKRLDFPSPGEEAYLKC